MVETRDRSKMDVSLGRLKLPNPVMNASGTAGYGTEGLPYLDPESLGAFVTKGLSMEPRPGNPPPRIIETPAGMLNAVGLENIGLPAFCRDHLPSLETKGVRVIVNFFGETDRGYCAAARYLDSVTGICAIEMNVSCPNVRQGGRIFGRNPEMLNRLVRSVRQETALPLFIKLTPDDVDILDAAQAAWEAGCDAITIANTYMGLAVDVRRRRPRLSIGTGGLSGPAIRPMSVYRVWRVARRAPVPVIGVGGILSAQDALEYLVAGASAVQVGSGFFANPGVYREIFEGLHAYLEESGHFHISEIIGGLQDMPDP